MKNQKTEKTIQEFTEAFQRLEVDQDILIIACNHHITIKEEALYDKPLQKDLREEMKRMRKEHPHHYVKSEILFHTLYTGLVRELTSQMNHPFKAHKGTIDTIKQVIISFK